MATFLRIWAVVVLTISSLAADEQKHLNPFSPPTEEGAMMEFKEAFKRIDGAINRGDYSTAARLLAIILQHSSGVKGNPLVQDGQLLIPVSEAVLKRLPNLPGASLELFKTLSEPLAERAFKQADTKENLLSFIKRYPLADAAVSAAELLLDISLEQGDGRMALIAISSLKKRKKTSFMLKLKTAVADSLLGNPSNLTHLLDEIPDNSPTEEVFKNFLKSLNRPSDLPVVVNTYPNSRLTLKQQDASDALGRASVLWKMTLPLRTEYPVYPLLLGGRLFVSSLTLFASIDSSSGRLLASRSFADTAVQNKERFCPIPHLLATDGEHIYGTFWSRSLKSPHLYALSPDGKTIWSTDSTYDPFLNRAYICSAPLLHNETIFVAAAVKKKNDSDIYLLAFSKEGDFLWRLYLGTVAPTRVARPALRGILTQPEPLPPVTLSADEYTVFFCTNSGAIGAVDTSGKLDWLLLYPIYREKKETITFYEESMITSIYNPPVVSKVKYEGRRYKTVIASPADTNRIVGVLLGKGAAFWVPRYESACILLFNDNLVVIESGEKGNRITLLHPPTAKVVWRSKLDRAPIAPPTLIRDGLILPATEKAVLLKYTRTPLSFKKEVEIELPILREEGFEGRFFRRKRPPIYAEGIFLQTKENIIVVNSSGMVAALKQK